MDNITKSFVDNYYETLSEEEKEELKDLDYFKKELLREIDEQIIWLINNDNRNRYRS